MQKRIKIGSLIGELTLRRANFVASQFHDLEVLTEIIAIDSKDYKSLDSALLKGEIDIAVHAMIDLPDNLPPKIVKAAILKRAGSLDVILFKGSEEFLSSRKAVIASPNLRTKAQWLNQYPEHTVVDFEGDIESCLQQFEDSDWNGAIFPQSDLQRLKLLPKDHVKLGWMVPEPAQGVTMLTALESNEDVLALCKKINHTETEICTHIERDFLKTFNCGKTAPVGALAYIKETKIVFKGVLFSLDGTRKIEIDKSSYMVEHKDLGQKSAEDILERGGKRLLAEISGEEKKVHILSTKQLATSQTDIFDDEIGFKMSDFVAIRYNRLKPSVVKNTIENVIISDIKAVEALLQNFSPIELDFANIYCAGRRVKRLIEKKIKKVTHVESSVQELAEFIVKMRIDKGITYFCGNEDEELKDILAKNEIEINTVEAYRIILNERKFDDDFDAVLFYSVSGVESFMEDNLPKDAIAFCIGQSTADEAKKHFKKVEVSKMPTIESVLNSVNKYFK